MGPTKRGLHIAEVGLEEQAVFVEDWVAAILVSGAEDTPIPKDIRARLQRLIQRDEESYGE
jgi:hypothetical protein